MNEQIYARCNGSGVNIGGNDDAPRFTRCAECDSWVIVTSDFVNARIAEHSRLSLYLRIIGDYAAVECSCGQHFPPERRNLAFDRAVAHEEQHRAAGIPGTVAA